MKIRKVAKSVYVVFVWSFPVLTLIACSGGDMRSNEASENTADSNIGSTAEKVTIGNFIPTWLVTSGYGFKIARAPSGVPYVWDWTSGNGAAKSGESCSGSGLNLRVSCPVAGYTSPKQNHQIKGIGIQPTNSHVYVWYSEGGVNGSTTEGTSDKLDYYHNPTFYTMPTCLASHGITSMDQLLDADISPNGQVYYYWGSAIANNVWRTVGTSVPSPNATCTSVIVRSSNNPPGAFGELVSVAFAPGGNIEAYYGDGQVVSSSTSTNLRD